MKMVSIVHLRPKAYLDGAATGRPSPNICTAMLRPPWNACRRATEASRYPDGATVLPITALASGLGLSCTDSAPARARRGQSIPESTATNVRISSSVRPASHAPSMRPCRSYWSRPVSASRPLQARQQKPLARQCRSNLL